MATVVDLQSEKSRQKSCNACVRSKRRCDKQTPRCTRCSEKNTDCVYQNLPSGTGNAAVDDSEDSAPMDVDPLDTQEARCTSTNTTNTTDFELDFGAAPSLDSFESLLRSSTTTTSSNSISSLSMDIPFEYSPLSFLQDPMGMDLGNLGLEPWQAVAPPKEIQPPVLRVTSSQPTQDMEACNSCEFNVWDLYEPNNRMAKAVNYMTKFHATFAREREATCIHRHLYRATMPDSIHRAFMAAVMYANRTTANKSWVFRLLVENCASLLQTEAHTPLEKLARTHALFIYQTIRMFDGDLTLRAQSQKQMPIFLEWIQELIELRDNLDDMTLLDSMAINSRPPKSWEKWIFNECVRRTIMTGYAFVSMTMMMLKEDGQEEAWDYWQQKHRWTISQALWKADSSTAFFAAWRDQPQYIIENFEIDQFIRLGKAEEVDDFVLVVLYVTFGNEAAEHLAMAGEALMARQRAIV